MADNSLARLTERGARSPRFARAALMGVIALYLVLGALYAVETPRWQVPDEPAHYNYVRFLAEQRRLPELREGDYPHAYIEELKAARFPPERSIDGIRYEFHQPPLYYALGALVYGAAGPLALPMPLTLRLFSLGLGALSLWISYRVVRAIYPDEPLLALGTAAFVATLPMHLAMTAAVNNDVLVELLLGLIAWQLVREPVGVWRLGRSLALGMLLGLAALTKLQALVGFGLAGLALAWDAWHSRRAPGARPWRMLLTHGAAMGLLALVIALPWLLRNASVYGWDDLLGLKRHDLVVAGQLTTREYLHQNGLRSLLVRMALFTFQSFWGQFGWMGVVLHIRFYLAALTLCGVVGIGLAHQAICWARRGEATDQRTRRGLALMAVWALLTAAGLVWYNTRYFQPQGRYLFPAIATWGLLFTLGLHRALGAATRHAVIALGALFVGLLIVGLATGNLQEFSLAMLAALMGALLGGQWLERRFPGAALALFYLGMAVVALVCLCFYIVPQLSR